MATNAAVRAALLAKLKVTPRRLNQIANARKRELPMSLDQAYFTIAHENSIDLAKLIRPEDLAEVRTLMAELRASKAATPSAPTAPPAAKTTRNRAKVTTAKPIAVTIAGVDVGEIPALKATHAKGMKTMAERVYPTLYLFENSVRDLVERVLQAECGPGWWAAAVPAKVQKAAAELREAEKKDPWHGPRGKRDLDYLLLNHLWDIIHHNWKRFEPLFPGHAWVETMITSDMNVSRRVFAHMNPLTEHDIANIENAFRKWVRQLKAREHLIP